MSECPRGDIRDLLPDLLHGRLEAAARAEVERHLATCADCAAEAKLLRSMRAALSRTPAVDAARITAAVQGARAAQPTAGRRRSRASSWRVAAAVAALAAGALSYAVLHRERHPEPARVQPLARNETPSVAQPSVSKPPVSTARGGSSSTAPQVAVSPSTMRPAQPVDGGIVFGGGLSDLADSDLEALLQDAETLDAVPDAEPTPVLEGIGEEAS